MKATFVEASNVGSCEPGSLVRWDDGGVISHAVRSPDHDRDTSRQAPFVSDMSSGNAGSEARVKGGRLHSRNANVTDLSFLKGDDVIARGLSNAQGGTHAGGAAL